MFMSSSSINPGDSAKIKRGTDGFSQSATASPLDVLSVNGNDVTLGKANQEMATVDVKDLAAAIAPEKSNYTNTPPLSLINKFTGDDSASPFKVNYPTIDPQLQGDIRNRIANSKEISVDRSKLQLPSGVTNFQARFKRNDAISKFVRSSPEVVQVNQFPFTVPRGEGVTLEKADGNNNISKSYEYDYNSDWTLDPRSGVKNAIKYKLTQARKFHNIIISQNKSELLELQSNTYNRDKVPIMSLGLDRSFGHIFFIKPNCNVLNAGGMPLTLSNGGPLGNISAVGNDPEALSIVSQNPKLLWELCADYPANREDHFSLLLSNKALGIQVNDESISVDTYGDSWYGFKTSIGKAWEGRDPGNVTINFADDRYLSCYNLVRLWMLYIDRVYHGAWSTLDKYRVNKVIDYATAIYYILTAEDGCRIVFWSKLVGVFPSSANSSALSGNLKDTIAQPEISVTFQYAFKIDMDPTSIVEFNQMSSIVGDLSAYKFVESYNRKLDVSNPSFVGAPFISIDKDVNGHRVYNLRFKSVNLPDSLYADKI